MGYTEAQAREFIAHIAPMMYTEGRNRGYKVISTAIAQAIIEGACGTSKLAKPPYNNHFGLKCGSAWKGRSVNMKTMEDYGAGLVNIRDNFRCYDSLSDCVAGYYDFISTKRYANLKTAKNYSEYANMLKADGYATSSTYVNTLCKTVMKYGLDKYDNSVVPTHADEIDRIAHEVIDGLWSSGTTRKLRLEQAGYSYNEVQNRVNEILKG